MLKAHFQKAAVATDGKTFEKKTSIKLERVVSAVLKPIWRTERGIKFSASLCRGEQLN